MAQKGCETHFLSLDQKRQEDITGFTLNVAVCLSFIKKYNEMTVLFLLSSLPSSSFSANQMPCRVGISSFQMPCLISSFPSVQFLLQDNKLWVSSTSLCVYIRSSTLFVSMMTSGENISPLFHLTAAVKVSKTQLFCL